MALAERGTAQAELGQFDKAGELIDLAVERTPGVFYALPVCSRLDSFDARQRLRSARRCRPRSATNKYPAMATRRTPTLARDNADREAAYFFGNFRSGCRRRCKGGQLLRAGRGHARLPVLRLQAGPSRALLAAGRHSEALELVRAAATERDPGEIRLDLELDRTRALLWKRKSLPRWGKAQRQRRMRAPSCSVGQR